MRATIKTPFGKRYYVDDVNPFLLGTLVGAILSLAIVETVFLVWMVVVLWHVSILWGLFGVWVALVVAKNTINPQYR